MKILFRTFAFIILSAYLQPAWADDFEEMLEKEEEKWARNIAVYRLAKQKFAAENHLAAEGSAKAVGHLKEADKWAQEIFLGVANWIFQNESWGMVEHAKILTSPLKSTNLIDAESEVEDIKEQAHEVILKLEEQKVVAKTTLRNWYQKRLNASEGEKEDAFEAPFNAWYARLQAEQLQVFMQKHFIEGPRPIGFFKGEGGASTFLTTVLDNPFFSTHSMIDSRVLQRFCDSMSTVVSHYWNGSHKDSDMAAEGYHAMLIRMEIFDEASDVLLEEVRQKAYDFLRKQQGMDVVYHKGTESEFHPSLIDIETEIQDLYGTHISLGRSKEIPVDHIGNLNTLMGFLKMESTLKASIYEAEQRKSTLSRESTSEVVGANLALATLEAAVARAMTSLGPISSGINQLWFKTAHERTVQPLLMEEHVELEADTLYGQACMCLSAMLDIEKSEVSELTKYIQSKMQKRKARALWNRRAAAESFRHEDPQQHRDFLWDDNKRFDQWMVQFMGLRPASAVISWETPWGYVERFDNFYDALAELSFESSESLQSKATDLWKAHGKALNDGEVGESILGGIYAEAMEVGHKIRVASARLKRGKDINQMNVTIAQAKIELRQLWKTAMPLPDLRSENALDETLPDLWSSVIAPLLELYTMLDGKYGPKAGAPASEISVMLTYQATSAEDDEFANILRGRLGDSFHMWNRRSAFGLFTAESDIERHKLRYQNWGIFVKFVTDTMEAHEAYSEVNTDSNPPFIEIFTLEEDKHSTDLVDVLIEKRDHARKLWEASPNQE